MPLYQLPNEQFKNVNLNSVGSQYAQDFNHDISLLVEKVTNEMIFDASPQQFFDLKLLNMKPFVQCNSDEFFFKEMGYQRDPLTATGGASAVVYPTTQTFSLSSVDGVAPNMVITYPNNQKGTVINVNTSSNEITVSPYTNGTLPAVVASYSFSLHSSVEADGADGWANYFRAQTIERHNYIQLFNKAIRYGEVELFKLKNAGVTRNFLAMEKMAMFRQFRIDISNAFWNGDKAEGTVESGDKAKLTGGIWPGMVAAGSPNALTPLATLPDAFEDVVLGSEFGEYGQVRFCFGSNKAILAISKQYKDEKTRYKPNDMIAQLNLDEIRLGSSRIVFVPYDRLRDRASFPAGFENRLFILDMRNINLRQMWGERSGETLDRVQGIPKRYKELWVDANMGVEFNNPLGCGWVDIQF